MDTLISVIMPAYKAEKYIVQAMDSVIHQTAPFGIELRVIEDCSPDGTFSIIKEYAASVDLPKNRQLFVCKNDRNVGAAESRNRGIREARGKYIAFLDADDWWEAEKIEKQWKLIEEKNAILCATGRELMTPEGKSAHKVIGIPGEVTYDMLLRTNSIPCSSVVLRTDVAREFYMVHPELHEDYILWLSVLKKYGKAYGINEPLTKCRLSQGGKSRNKIKSARMHFGVYRYMGVGFFPSLYYFSQYAINGVKKYFGKSKRV